LPANHRDGLIFKERIEEADRVGAAADAGHQEVRQPPLLLQNLPPGFVADHPLEIPDHQRIGVRAIRGAKNVMCRAHVRNPVAHRFVDGLLQRLLAGFDGHDLGAEHLHAQNIQGLPLAVHRPHIDDALQPKHRGDRGGGDPVLARAGFGNDARLAHAAGEQDLADAVVDLVRPRVEQVLAFQIDLRSAQLPREPFRKVERRGPAAEFPEVILELALELGVLLRAAVFGLQLLQRMHQRFRHITAAVRAEVAMRVGYRVAGDRTHSRQDNRPPRAPSSPAYPVC